MQEQIEHITDYRIANPRHTLRIALVGAGGTGSQVANCLARMNHSLKALNHPGIHVTVYDPDVVSSANIGRQLYSPSELGLSKASAVVTRINRFFGFDWDSVGTKFTNKDYDFFNILITCVDNVKSRRESSMIVRSNVVNDDRACYYWLDFGNSKTTGQAILGSVKDAEHLKTIGTKPSSYVKSVRMKTVLEMYPDMEKFEGEDQGPSCSIAQALLKQDLFINSTLAQLGCNILWKLLMKKKIAHHGVFLNLDTLTSTPIKIAHFEKPKRSTKKKKINDLIVQN